LTKLRGSVEEGNVKNTPLTKKEKRLNKTSSKMRSFEPFDDLDKLAEELGDEMEADTDPIKEDDDKENNIDYDDENYIDKYDVDLEFTRKSKYEPPEIKEDPPEDDDDDIFISNEPTTQNDTTDQNDVNEVDEINEVETKGEDDIANKLSDGLDQQPNKDFKCNQCQYSGKSEGSYKKHVRDQHTKDKDLKCEQCNYVTSQKGNLSKHVKMKHGSNEVHGCQYCEYTSNIKCNITRHEKSKHNNGQS